jgi:hypothetical protein
MTIAQGQYLSFTVFYADNMSSSDQQIPRRGKAIAGQH